MRPEALLIHEVDDIKESLNCYSISIMHACCRWPWLIRTEIPPLLQYPTKPAAFAFQTALVQMFYAPGLTAKVGGLIALLKALLRRTK